MCIEAINLGMQRVILPKENSKEAAIVNGLEVIGVEKLGQVIGYLNGEITIEPENIDIEKYFHQVNKYGVDFSEVKGQESIKRALEIAAAGGHNCLLIGTPGSGKTMMARRIPTILPELTLPEALEITKIHSIAGTLPNSVPLITTRPFRAPHHTISSVSLVGGGRIPKPGEISLSHYGVLFLDELPEFNKNTLEVLRGPIEDCQVTISRVSANLTYPCNFMFVASMNPCPCGNFGSPDKECTCSQESISRYVNKISEPLLDRIDIHIDVQPVKYEKLEKRENIESSQEIRKRVNEARKIQLNRYKESGIYSNSELTPKLIEEYCQLNRKGKEILKKAFEKLGLSARAHGRILKVARTIADIDAKKEISPQHIAEAIQYRSLDRKYWGRK